MFLTIIIPAYNVRRYLESCVDSVAAFPVEDKEIIIIDDGSTDGTFDDELELLKAVSCQCKIIHQQNGGVSKARNVGIAEAKGEWLWFVDSDDFVDSNVTIDLDKLKSSDFVLTGFVWEENGIKTEHGAKPQELPYNLWRCWFRTEIVRSNSIRFVVGRKYAEDQEFIWKYLLCRNSINNTYPIVEPVYHYTLRPGSAMTKKGVKMKKFFDIAKVTSSFAFRAMGKGLILKTWVLHELKRMLKVQFIVLFR